MPVITGTSASVRHLIHAIVVVVEQCYSVAIILQPHKRLIKYAGIVGDIWKQCPQTKIRCRMSECYKNYFLGMKRGVRRKIKSKCVVSYAPTRNINIIHCRVIEFDKFTVVGCSCGVSVFFKGRVVKHFGNNHSANLRRK
jgi:hypothetical protein